MNIKLITQYALNFSTKNVQDANDPIACLGLIQRTDCIVEQTEELQSQTREVYRRSGNFALQRCVSACRKYSSNSLLRKPAAELFCEFHNVCRFIARVYHPAILSFVEKRDLSARFVHTAFFTARSTFRGRPPVFWKILVLSRVSFASENHLDSPRLARP